MKLGLGLSLKSACIAYVKYTYRKVVIYYLGIIIKNTDFISISIPCCSEKVSLFKTDTEAS